MRRHFAVYALACAAPILAACSIPAATSTESAGAERAAFTGSIKTPALIVTNGQARAIQYWTISPHGGNRPTTIATFSELAQSGEMAADGNVVAIAIFKPPSIVFFDAQTGSHSSVSDPFGTPVSLAIDKNENVFALNNSYPRPIDVTMYPAGSTKPRHLTCDVSLQTQEIAADNEGDLIVSGYQSSWVKAVEFPNTSGGLQSGNCSLLPLRAESDYLQGLAVDPKTDDLIVFTNPNDCAGPDEARITVYSKPYDKKTAHWHDAGGTCPYGFKLAADSRTAFFIDTPYQGGPNVRQVSYPDGKRIAIYTGSFPAAITTIPNTLPN